MANVFGFSQVMAIVGDICDAWLSTGGDDIEKKMLQENRGTVMASGIRHKGNITKLLKPYIIEPLIVVTENAARTDIIDQVNAISTDIFSCFYMQAFDVLTQRTGLSSQTAITLLSTDSISMQGIVGKYGEDLLIKQVGRTAKELANENSMTYGELNDFLYANPLLTMEDAIDDEIKIARERDRVEDRRRKIEQEDKKEKREEEDKKNKEEQDKENLNINKREYVNSALTSRGASYNKGMIADDKAIGSLILQRNLVLKTVSRLTKGSAKPFHIEIPITVRARVIIVKMGTILTGLAPARPENSFTMRMLDYRSGLLSLSDLLFSSDLVKKYKNDKFNSTDEFLKILNERRMGSKANFIQTGAEGFEKSYNSFVITESDRIIINKELGGDIYKERFKEKFLEALDGMSVSVIDDDHERLTVLTRSIRGISDTSFRALRKNKNSNQDMTELFKALSTSRPLF